MNRLPLLLILATLAMAGCRKKEAPASDRGHAHDAPSLGHEVKILSEQALKNMGVVVEEVDSSNFVVSRPVVAVIKETPFNERPLSAPFSGRIKSIPVALGEFLESGRTVIKIIRDPIPRPQLSLIQDLLKPASEEFHETIAALRTARVDQAINDRERARLKAIQGDGKALIAKQTLLNLEYQSERFAQNIANHRAKLTLHGFSKKEIDDIESGKGVVLSKNLWFSALKENGVWTDTSEAVLKALPDSVRANQWSIASIGELTAEGLLTMELAEFLSKNPTAAINFIEIGGLLQQGNSLDDIKDLHALGAFAPIISVKAPQGKNWDVESIHVKIGQRVERGSTLITLTNHSDLYLIAHPVGSEIAAVNAALERKDTFTARPLTQGTGPELKGLRISKIQGLDEEGTRVLLPVTNVAQDAVELNGRKFRNWKLRNRMRYVLQVPERVLEDVIVLPSAAVVDYGNDKVIYVKNGDAFERRNVVLSYRNDRVAVLGEGSEVFPAEPMVVAGAFELGLALRSTQDASADPHAGHDH